jgi:hypothetical protein
MSWDVLEEPATGAPSSPGSGADIALGEIEWRASSVYARAVDAHAVYPIDPADVHDPESRQIIAGILKVVAAQKKLTPVNMHEIGGIPEALIEQRINGYKPGWVRDMGDYIERIQAEGFRTRGMRERRDSYQDLATCPWRDVEKTHAKGAQSISSVQIGGVGGYQDDAGYIWDGLTELPPEEMTPLPFPWPWVNAAVKGGMFKGKKYVFGGPPGQRKTSALFCAIHHAVMNLNKVWVHFPFDGGTVNEQILKFSVVDWVSLLIAEEVPLLCKARVLHGGAELGTATGYMYANTTVVFKMLLLRKEKKSYRELGVNFPPKALELFEKMCQRMAALRDGKGPGLLVMVSPKAIGMDVYRVAQRLRNELYGRNGVDGWSLDHMGKPNNRYSDDQQRIPENTRVLTGFTDMEGPPCILISQLSAEGIRSLGKGLDVDPHLRYNQELFQDADGIFMFQYNGELPQQVTMIPMKNREGRGGPKINYPLRVQPDSGWIWDDPEWASGVRKTAKKAVEPETWDGDESMDDNE